MFLTDGVLLADTHWCKNGMLAVAILATEAANDRE
jgi:hypothetical protein